MWPKKRLGLMLQILMMILFKLKTLKRFVHAFPTIINARYRRSIKRGTEEQ